MIYPEVQVQSNGIELTLQRTEVYEGSGSIAFYNSERKLPGTKKMDFDDEGWVHPPKGSYNIVFNEIANIPKNTAAIAKPAQVSCGATVETAVWDAGYSGRSEEVYDGYSGVYQNENV